jgi:hypothetical protein
VFVWKIKARGFFGDEMFMEDGALQLYRPCPSAAYAAYAFYFSRRNKTLIIRK